MKVVELRAALADRGLDVKGNKPVLVERLRKALEEENQERKSHLSCTNKCSAFSLGNFAIVCTNRRVRELNRSLYRVMCRPTW